LLGEGASSPFGFAPNRSVNYFCPYHGKGPCDAFFGLMSRHFNAVIENKDIVSLRDIIDVVVDWQYPSRQKEYKTSFKFLMYTSLIFTFLISLLAVCV
jgi:cytochrome b subunit of formate dehydrogenase